MSVAVEDRGAARVDRTIRGEDCDVGGVAAQVMCE